MPTQNRPHCSFELVACNRETYSRDVYSIVILIHIICNNIIVLQIKCLINSYIEEIKSLSKSLQNIIIVVKYLPSEGSGSNTESAEC